MAFFKFLNQHSDITDITFRDRHRFAPLDQFTQRLLRGDSAISVSEREIIAAYVSRLNECSFCSGIHTQVAANFGVEDSLIERLVVDINSSGVSEKLVPLLKYVYKLTLHPNRMIMEDAQAVYDAGWSENSLSDAICICSLFNLYNRLLDGHGVKGNIGIYKMGADHLYKNGYGVPWFIKYIKGYVKKKRMKIVKDSMGYNEFDS
jgi:uncharacterized peroxidase-related enzyme